jgi:chaperonin GroEL
MPHKQVLFRSAAREKILRGATQLADAVRVTLGPRSKSVLIEKKWGAPIVCNDGVTIAKEFDLKDPEENLGAQMLRQAAEKTGDLVGDGTSTSTILAHAIFADGLRNVVAGASAIDIKRGLDRATKSAVEALKAFDRDDALAADLLHGPRHEFADGGIVMGGNGGHLGLFLAGRDRPMCSRSGTLEMASMED